MKHFLVYLAKGWYKVLDSNGFLFTTLKEFKIQIRFLFYILSTFSIFFGLNYISSFIDLDTYKSLNSEFKLILTYIGYFILYFSTLLTAMLSLYEFIYDIDIDTIKKKKKRRFRNVDYKIRIIIYVVSFVFIFQYVYFGFLFSISETTQNATFSNNGLILEFSSLREEKAFSLFFKDTLIKLTISISTIYLLIVWLIESRIKKQRVSLGN